MAKIEWMLMVIVLASCQSIMNKNECRKVNFESLPSKVKAQMVNGKYNELDNVVDVINLDSNLYKVRISQEIHGAYFGDVILDNGNESYSICRSCQEPIVVYRDTLY